jgi:hypothetical protein
MFKVYIRVFPKNRRASFTSREIALTNTTPKVEDLFKACGDLSIDDYIVSRGTSFIKASDSLIHGETLNIMPK